MKTGPAWCLLRDHLLLTKKWQNPPKDSLGNMSFALRFHGSGVNPRDLLSSKALTGTSAERLLRGGCLGRGCKRSLHRGGDHM